MRWQGSVDAPMTLEEQLRNMSMQEWNHIRHLVNQTPYLQKDLMIWWHGSYAAKYPERRIEVVRAILESLCEVE